MFKYFHHEMLQNFILALSLLWFEVGCDSNLEASTIHPVGTFVKANSNIQNCATVRLKECPAWSNELNCTFPPNGTIEDILIQLPTLAYMKYYPNETDTQQNLDLTIFPVKRVSVNNILSVEIPTLCFLSLCDEPNLLGDCIQLLPKTNSGAWTTLYNNSEDWKGIIYPGMSIDSFLCVCDSSWLPILDGNGEFDRNFVGVVYSPFDKYWEENSEGVLERVSPSNYSLLEIRESLRVVASKFSSISATTLGGVFTIANDNWDLVALAAAQINTEAGFLAFRLSLKISPETMGKIVNGSITANTLFPGTVWGLAAAMGQDEDSGEFPEPENVLSFINQLKALVEELKWDDIKIGVSFEYKDNVGIPAWKVLLDRGPNIDFVLCHHNIGTRHIQNSSDIQALIGMKQEEFAEMARVVRGYLPPKKLFISTGIPSKGIGNGLSNSPTNLMTYWLSMAYYAKVNKTMIHLHEALDEPWKVEADEIEGEILNSRFGPNGSDAHEGWWRREDNSNPALYLEKVWEPEPETPNENGDEKDQENVGSSGNVTKVFVGISVFSIFVIFGLSVYFWGRIQNTKKLVIGSVYVEQFHEGRVGPDNKDDEYYAVALRLPYDKRHELPKGCFGIDMGRSIGSGQSGTVFLGTISNIPDAVAFKCTNSSSSVLDLKNLLSEIKILSYIGSHENVVCMLGAYTRKIQKGVVYFALEYCPLGSLERFLKSIDPKCLLSKKTDEITFSRLNSNYVTTETIFESSDDLNIQQDCKRVVAMSNDVTQQRFVLWAYQIASGMEFVSSKKVIHADLAARNILLITEDRVKISDFGLSKKLYTEINGAVTHHDKTTPLPWRWMAPESLRELAFSVESDVWSFGVTIWEIFSLARQVPFEGVQFNEEFVINLENGFRLLQAPFAPEWIHEQCSKCWNLTTSKRPTFSELRECFRKFSSPPCER